MYRKTRIYIDQSQNAASEEVHVPAMGLHEVMPPGLIRHGGIGTGYPCLMIAFHDDALSLAPDRRSWLQVGNCFIVWNYEALHSYGNYDRPWDHSWLRVTGRWMERTLRNTPVPLGVPIDIGGDELPLRYLRMISDELRGSSWQDPDMLEGLLRVFWHDVERRVIKERVVRRADSRLERARRFIETNFDKPFKLAEAAEQAHLSPSHFCSSFSRQLGVPPREYAMRLRLQRSAQLLANPEFAVSQVAEMVGCPDALYFSRLFRHRYGLSPTQYRHQQDPDALRPLCDLPPAKRIR